MSKLCEVSVQIDKADMEGVKNAHGELSSVLTEMSDQISSQVKEVLNDKFRSQLAFACSQSLCDNYAATVYGMLGMYVNRFELLYKRNICSIDIFLIFRLHKLPFACRRSTATHLAIQNDRRSDHSRTEGTSSVRETSVRWTWWSIRIAKCLLEPAKGKHGRKY